MLRSIKEMLDYSILATDGEIGHVSDILLGDSPSGRKVLLSTAWLSGGAPEKRLFVVNIDKKRIEESPPYDSTVDIPREYETRLHDHYGYPYYWQP
jgi:hypothetical protein